MKIEAVVDEMRGLRGHASAATGRAQTAAFAAEGDRSVRATVVAAEACEAVGQHAALEEAPFAKAGARAQMRNTRSDVSFSDIQPLRRLRDYERELVVDPIVLGEIVTDESDQRPG